MAFGDTIVAAVLGGPATPQDNDAANNSVAEGAAVNTPVGITAFAKDTLAVTYSLSADSSGGGFKIDPNTGVVTVADPSKIDFESAAGNAYAITVRAFDGIVSSTQTFTIAVNDAAPSAPVDSNAAGNTVLEGAANGTAVGITASSADVNGPAVTWSLTGDTSGGGFTINAATGVITVADGSKIDYESSPGHAYTVTAQASDGTLTSAQTFTIDVGDVAMTTPVDANGAANSVAEGAAAGTNVGITASAVDPNGPATTYSLIGDTSGGGFTINASTGVVTVANSSKIDFETSGAGHNYGITVQASNGLLTTSQAFTIGVTNLAPSTPTDGDGAANTVVEGAANGTTVGLTASSSDVNGPSGAVTYAITGDTSGGGFTINSTTGVVTVADATKINFETATHSYTVTTRASDGTSTSSQSFNIAVTDVAPTTPVDNSGATDTVAEGAAAGTLVGITASSTDINGPGVTYTLSADSSNGGFAIDPTSGVITVKDPTKIDYETSGAGHSYSVTATASDGTLASSKNFTIAVADVTPSGPSDINNAPNSVAEGAANGSTVGITALSVDPNGPAATYSLTDNAGGRFAIDPGTGVVTVLDGTLLDFETSTSHSITVQAVAGAQTVTQNFTINVTNVAPSAPGDSDAASEAVSEGAALNTTVGITATSTDPNGPAVVWSIFSDTSLGGFKINPSSGVVSVADPTKIDYETAPGVGHSYSVVVQASDSHGGNTTRPFTIVVNNTNPTVPQDTNGAVGGNVTEAAAADTTVGITASATDLNGPAVNWSIIGDTSGGGFKIDSNGIVSVKDASKINYETAPGLNHSYDITVQASDGAGGTSSQVFNILVANVAPSTPTEVADGTAGGSVLEAAAADTLVGITASSTDLNGPAVNWSITADTSGSGFKIDSNGVVSVADPTKINYETAPGANHSYDITVQASDGAGGTSSSVFNILVGNVAPTTPTDGSAVNDAAGIQGKIEEGGTGGPVGITAVSSDPNGPAVKWSILSGSASGAFQIDPDSGVVSVLNGALLDYETAPLIGAGPARGHTILVQASDTAGGTSTQTFTIEVTNLAPVAPTDTDPVGDGAGTIKGIAAFDATAGTLVGIHAQSTGDPAGGTVTYELAAGSSSFFQVNSSTGEVSVSMAGEGNLVAGTNYDISVVAKDTSGLASGTSTATPFKIHVQTPAPNAPTDADTATNNVVLEGAPGVHGNFASSTYTGIQAQSATATSYSISADTSGGGFQIDPTTGKIYVDNGSLINYEVPGHKYMVTVVASDGSQTSSSNFFIDVADVAPTQPIDADPSAGVLADPFEGRVKFDAAAGSNVGITVSSSDVNGGALTYELVSNPGNHFAIDATTGVVTLASNAGLVAGTPVTFSARAVSTNGDSVGGTNVSAAQTFTVEVVANQPVIDLDANDNHGAGINYTTSFTEGGAAVAIADTDVTITEAGFTTLASATVKLTNAQLGDTLAVTGSLAGLGITANTVSGGGVITVTLSNTNPAAPASFADYQTALKAVTFSNTLDTPNTAVARTVTVTVNDGTNPASNAATTTITVFATNDAPDLTPHAPAAATGYIENAAPSALLSTGAVTDADNPADFSGGGFTVAITAGTVQTGDQIVVVGSGFSVSGSSLIFGGNKIGDIAFAQGSATVTNLTDDATPTVVNALVKAFGYQSSSEDPVSGSRTIQFTFNDGGHTGAGLGDSNVVTQTINVTAVNDAPTAVDNVAATQIEDTGPWTITGASLRANDFTGPAGVNEAGQTLSITGVSNFVGGTAVVNGSGDVVFTPTANFNGTASFDYTIQDNGPGTPSDVGHVTFAVTAVNDAPVVLANASPASVAFTEGDPGVQLLSAGTITDPDNPANFAGGSFEVAVTNAEAGDEIFVLGSSGFIVNGSSLEFAGHTIGTIAFAGATATVSGLTAFATPTVVNSLAEAFAYRNASDSFDTTDRTVSFTFHDGGNTGGGDLANVAAVTQTITLTAVNDAPVNHFPAETQIVATGDTLTFDLFSNGIFVSDPDAEGHVESVTLAVSHGTLTTTPVVSPSAGFGVTGDGTGSVVITGVLDDIKSALDGMIYAPTGGYTGTDALTIVSNDGGNTATGPLTPLTDSDTVSILVTSAGTGNPAVDLDNVDATATGNDYATTFTEAAPAVAIAGSVTIVDTFGADATDIISSATITLVNHQAGDTLAANGVLPGGILAVYTPATGVMTLTGATTAADYEAALHQIEFSNSSGNPSTVDRTISVTVTDDTATDSNTAIATIHVTAVNTAPSLDLDANDNHSAALSTGYTTSYTENGTPVAIVDTDVTITDPDNTTLVSATVTITNYDASGDLLSIAGALPAGITASYVGGVLTLTSDTQNTIAEYQDALKQIVYSTTSDTPDTTDRDITIVVNDGTSDSNVAHATVSVADFDDPPVNTVPAGPLAATEDTDFAITGLSVTDPDIGSGEIKVTLSVQHGTIHVLDNLGAGFLDPSDITGNDTASVTIQCDPANVNATLAALNGVVYHGDLNYNGADQLTMVSDDLGATGAGGPKTDTDTVAITVAAVNDAPVADLNGAPAGIDYSTPTYVYGAAAISVASATATVIDPDSANVTTAIITLTNAQAGDVLAINGPLPSGITATIVTDTVADPDTITVTLTGPASPAAFTAALKQVEFSNGNSAVFNDTDRTITVVVNDGTDSGPTATTTIDVANEAAPVANPDSVAATEAGGLNNATAGTNPSGNLITATGSAGAVADTHNGGPDPTLFVSAVDAVTTGGTVTGTVGTAMSGKYGSLTVNSDGSYSYSVDNSNAAVQALVPAGAPLQDVFHYTIKDAAGTASAPASITITISGANDLAQAFADIGSMSEDAAATKFSVEANDTLDPDSTAHNTVAITGTVTASGPAGTGIVNGSVSAVTSDPNAFGDTKIQVTLGGAFQALAAGETATVTVPYTLTGDAGQNSGPVNLVVTVNGVNDVPLAVDDTPANGINYSMTEDAAATSFVVLGNDTKDIDHTAANNITTGAVTVSGNAKVGNGDATATPSGAAPNQQVQVTLGANFQKLAAGETATVDVAYTLHGDGADASIAHVQVTVTGVNDAPVIDLLNTAGVQTTGVTATFTENGPLAGPSTPVSFLPQLTLTDPDGSAATGATVHLNNIQTGDVLTVNGGQTSGTLSGFGNIGFTVSGSDITFTGNTTLANYQSALQLVEFNNTSQNPNTTARTFAVSVNDGSDSGSSTATVNVVGVNDAPVNTAPDNLNPMSDTDFAFTGGNAVSVTDPDAGAGAIHVTLSTAHGNLSANLAGGATVFSGAQNSHTIGLNGTVTQINAALATMKYHGDVGFTGLDSITVLTNDQGNTPAPALSDTDVIHLGVTPKVWIIDNSVAGSGGDGSAGNPFRSIAEFNAASTGAATNEYVLLKTGTGTYSVTDGIHLKGGQTLVGGGDGLSFTNPIAGQPDVVFNPTGGTRPVISVGGTGVGIDLASNNTVHGLDVVTTATGAVGIDDNSGTADLVGNSVGSLSISNMQITGTGKAIDIDHGGALSVTLDKLTSTGSSTQGVDLGGGLTGSLTVNNTASDIHGATGADINLAGGGSLNVTYHGNITQGSNAALLSVDGGNTTTGHTGTLTFDGTLSATNGTGLQFANADGTYNFDTAGANSTTLAGGDAGIDILKGSDPTVGSSGTFNFGTLGTASTFAITNPTGAAFNLNSGNATVNYHGNITANNGRAVAIDTHTGNTITFDTGNISASGASASGLLVQNVSGGTVNFNDPSITLSTQGNNGVTLLNNSGGTVNFDSGGTGSGLDITTTSGVGFSANGAIASTVNVKDYAGATTSNTINSTNGTALNITNTTIGATGVTFRSISSGNNDAGADPVNGIVLNNTGSTGGLKVTGSGAASRDGSGGTIQNTTGDGVSLTSTSQVSLTHMNINGTGGQGVMGLGVNGFVSDWNSFSANGNATKEGAIRFGAETDPSATGLTGGAIGSPTETRIDNTLISGSFERGVSIFNNSGTLTQLNVHNTTIQNSTNGSGMLLELRDSAVASADLQNSTFTGNKAAGFQGVGTDSSTLTVNAIGAGGHANTFSNNNDGVLIGSTGAAHVTTEISNNTFSGNTPGVGITVSTFQSSTNQGSLSAKILSNTITLPGTALNDGIQSLNSGTGAVQHVKIDGNVINNNGTGNGIFVATPDNGSSPNYTAIVTNNTVNQLFTATAGHGAGNGIFITAFRGTGVFKVEGNTVNFPNSTAGNPNSVNDLDGIALFQSNNGTTTSGVASLERGSGSGTASAVLATNNPNAHASRGGPATFVSGTVTVVNNGTITLPLNAAPGGVAAASPGQAASTGDYHLSQAALDSVVAAAISQWAAAGASASQLAAMHATNFSVADLAANTVGQESSPAHITIDVDAAGHGWFVDPTPNDNSEFTHAQNAAGTDLLTDSTNAAAGHLDLLTTVTHELGHVIGLDDTTSPGDSHGLMFIDLVDGERRLPDATDVAQANSTSTAEVIEAALPQSAQAASGTPIVVGTAANDTIDAGHGGNILFGGAGADHFVFGSSTPLNAPTPAQITHVADYSAAEGDTFDFSAITSAFHNSSVNDALVVRAVEDASGKFATLQVDHIDPMGLPSAPNWVNVAQIDGAHSGDAVNVLIDNHSVHLAQIHVDLLV